MHIIDKAGVLATLWLEFKEDKEFKDFIEYNDIGLPLAYFAAEELFDSLKPLGQQYIDETFDMFVQLLGVTEEEIDEVFGEDISLSAILLYGYNKARDSKE